MTTMAAAMAVSAILEAVDDGRFRVRVIRAGLSANRNFYSDAVLQAATPLFEGARVFVKSDTEHLRLAGKDVRNLIGRIVDPRFVPGPGGDMGAVEAILEAIDPNDTPIQRLREAISRGMADLFGLSIDARCSFESVAGRRNVTRFDAVLSVDLIVEPSAGGAILGFSDALSTSQPGDRVMATDAPTPLEIVRRVERTGLPQPARDRVLEALASEDAPSEQRITEAIRAEGAYVAALASARGDQSGKVSGLGSVRVVEAEEDKKARMFDAFFDPNDGSVTSIRECYVDLTGDRHVTGRIPRSGRISEALDSTVFADVLGDAMQRAMVADYRDQGIYDVWRDLASIVPVSDFREQHRVRFGGYGDLPKVGESAPYLLVASPTDEEAKYRVEKRGGIETVTLEMIKNDDVGAVQKIPIRLSRAAKRTLSKFVLDLMRVNPVIFDGKALFHADHGNLATAALSQASLAAARLAMKRQPEKDSGDRLGVPPRFLWVPDDLEETAVDLFRRNTNNDANFIQALPIQIRPVWYWTDANDWYLSADRNDIPAVEVGFLDGKQEPELLVQDDPRSGSVFSNDVITYKLRHIYGGCVTDFRGLYKAVVP